MLAGPVLVLRPQAPGAAAAGRASSDELRTDAPSGAATVQRSGDGFNWQCLVFVSSIFLSAGFHARSRDLGEIRAELKSIAGAASSPETTAALRQVAEPMASTIRNCDASALAAGYIAVMMLACIALNLGTKSRS